MKYMIFLLIGFSAVLISFVIKKENQPDLHFIQAQGTITRINYSDGGNVWYYLNVRTENGCIEEIQSIHYAKTFRKYHVGDKVPVKYYTNNRKTLCEIDDSELVPCENYLKNIPKVLMLIGIFCIVLFVFLVAKSFI